MRECPQIEGKDEKFQGKLKISVCTHHRSPTGAGEKWHLNKKTNEQNYLPSALGLFQGSARSSTSEERGPFEGPLQMWNS
jgi:hypothetical protein